MSSTDPLVPPAGAVPLRRMPGRATWLEPAGVRGEARVVKVWRARGVLRRLGDRRRARREARRLEHAAALGLPVPALLACERREGAWRIEMSVIDAQTLDAWLDGGAQPPDAVSLARAGAAGAALVARLQGLGARLGDGHLGNLLVDARGRAFAIDFGHTHFPRRKGRFRPERALRELARLAGEALDRAPRRVVLAAAAGYWRALEAHQRAALGEWSAFVTSAERAARLDRRWRVRHGNDRWWRTSHHLETRPDGALARRELDGRLVERLVARARESRLASGALERTSSATFVAVVARSRAERRALERAWSAAGRLADHRVPAARPAVLVREPTPVAWLELPAAAVPGALAGPAVVAVLRALDERRLAVRPPPAPLAPAWHAGERAWVIAGDLAEP